MLYCYHCMTKIDNDNAVYCPECGKECRVHYPESSELPAGTTLANGRYIVGRALGSGGFGITYIGRDLNLDKKVVIKETFYDGLFSRNIYNKKNSNPLSVSYSGISFEKISGKALKECKALASAEELDDIVKVYDYFSENNTSYIITEFIDGETLSSHVRKNGRYTFDELYSKMKPLIESLAELHSMDIIHRDIKPENIMLKENRRKGERFVLIDFGLAHSTSVGATISSGMAFTPGYSPFEQRSFNGAEGKFIDVYALAATMYFALTGEAPETGVSDDVDVNFPKLAVLNEKYGVPKNVETALRKALNPDYHKRTQSLDKFIEEIERKSPDEKITKPQTAESKTTAAFAMPEPKEETNLTTYAQNADSKDVNADIEEFMNMPQAVYSPAPRKEPEKPKDIEPRKENKNTVPKKTNTESKEEKSKPVKSEKKSKAVLFVIAAVVIVGIVFGVVKMNGSKEDTNSETSVNSIETKVATANDFVDIAAGYFYTVGLKKDGTVVEVGYDYDGLCDVSNWKDIAAVSAGDRHTVGLKKDGTVVAVGYNGEGQCKVSDWKDIVAVSAGDWHTVGLKKDGTVVAVGDNKDGKCDVSDWNDIVAITAGYWHTVGLKKDGTVVAVGYNDDGQCDVSDWNDIVAISAGYSHTVGLKKDGTVVAVGYNGEGQCKVSDWKDIVAVSAGGWHTVGLKKDGTVVAVGDNVYGPCDVSDWKDIVAVSAGSEHTVGLKKDGKVVAVGNNSNGQCDVSDW